MEILFPCKAGLTCHREPLSRVEGSSSHARKAAGWKVSMKNNEEAAASAFDTIGTALYDLREKIAAMQQSHLSETIRQSMDRTDE